MYEIQSNIFLQIMLSCPSSLDFVVWLGKLRFCPSSNYYLKILYKMERLQQLPLGKPHFSLPRNKRQSTFQRGRRLNFKSLLQINTIFGSMKQNIQRHHWHLISQTAQLSVIGQTDAFPLIIYLWTWLNSEANCFPRFNLRFVHWR